MNLQILLTLFGFYIFGFNAFSQNCEDLQKTSFEFVSKGDLVNAERYADSSRRICSAAFGENSINYATSNFILGYIFSEKEDYQNSLLYFLKAENIFLKEFGKYGDSYQIILDNIGDVYLNLNKFDSSEIYFKKVLSIVKQNKGENSYEYCKAMKKVANVFLKKEDFAAARDIYLEVNKLVKNVLGIETIEFSESLEDLAFVYSEMDNYNLAEYYYVQAKNILIISKNEESSQYAHCINSLGLLYARIGDYEKAELFVSEANSIYKKILGDKSINYAIGLDNLAGIYYALGKYTLAEELYVKALELIKFIDTENSLTYAITLGNLGDFYYGIGDLKKAEITTIQSLQIKKSILPYLNSSYATALNNLAMIYTDLNNYNKAEKLFLESLNILKINGMSQNLSYAVTIGNLANVYSIYNNFDRADSMFNVANELIKSISGIASLDYANALFKTANAFRLKKRFHEANIYFNQAISSYEKIIGKENKSYINAVNGLAISLSFLGENRKSIPLFKQVIDFYTSKVPSISFGSLTNLCNNLAIDFDAIGEVDSASFYYSKSIKFYADDVKNNLSFLSSRQIENYTFESKSNFNLALSFLHRNNDVPLKESLFNFNLLVKNLLLFTSSFLEKSISESKDEKSKEDWEKYKNLKYQITNLSQSPIENKVILNKLILEAENIEKEFLFKFNPFNNIQSQLSLSWEDLKKTIKPGEIIIDFVEFGYDKNGWTDSVFYGAFLIRSDWSKPKFVSLFCESDIKKHLVNASSPSDINYLYQVRDSSRLPNLTLYSLIWEKLSTSLIGISRVYFSPAGLLNKISFTAIPSPITGCLNDYFEFRNFGSFRNLFQRSNFDFKSADLYGGINYDDEPDNLYSIPSSDHLTFLDSMTFQLRGNRWGYLSNTLSEVVTINKVLLTNKVASKVFSNKNASEDQFKLSFKEKYSTPSIVHFATHGFVFNAPDTVDNSSPHLKDKVRFGSVSFKKNFDPLVRSGLVLAGANKLWSSGEGFSNKEDGILTAREIADLDLRACDLVVLSACETGLGDIQGSEGVFGLRRAFKIAGVKTLIVSFWKVPDKETREFMISFYNRLFMSNSINEAFRDTQIEFSKLMTPFQWAAFNLIE